MPNMGTATHISLRLTAVSLIPRFSFPHSLPIVWQRFAWINNVGLFYTERVDVSDDRSDILDVHGIFNDRNQVLASKLFDFIGSFSDRRLLFLWGFIFHICTIRRVDW